MDKTEIQKKALELQDILSKYQSELSLLEKELFNTIGEYQKMVEESRSLEKV